MKKLITVFLITILFFSKNFAQDIAGSYFLENIPDTKTGFHLNKNNTFSFFYMHNGINRHANGRWLIEKNEVKFVTRGRPVRCYRMVQARRVNDNNVIVQFTDDNPEMIKGIVCILYTAKGRQRLRTNAEGIVKFPKAEVDSIQVSSENFPDHSFTYYASNKAQNSFEFEFEKCISEVFLDEFPLLITENGFLGRHPLLKGTQFIYQKNETD